MALQFTPELEERIERHLSTGACDSAEALVAEALDLYEANRDALEAELRHRRDEIQSGQVQPVTGTEVMTSLRRRIEQYRASG